MAGLSRLKSSPAWAAGNVESGSTEVWSYPSGGSTENYPAAQTYGSGKGTYSATTTHHRHFSGTGSPTTFSVGRSFGRIVL